MSEKQSGRLEGSPPDEEDLKELLKDLEELEDEVDSEYERRTIRETIETINRLTGGRIFGLDDVAQQMIGGFLLSAPFVVTEEVWSLAAAMNRIQWSIVVAMVVLIGYGALYRADHDRDAQREESIGGLPLRFVSLILISYLSVAILSFVLSAPKTFEATPLTTAKAISIGGLFSVVGAATADSLF